MRKCLLIFVFAIVIIFATTQVSYSQSHGNLKIISDNSGEQNESDGKNTTIFSYYNDRIELREFYFKDVEELNKHLEKRISELSDCSEKVILRDSQNNEAGKKYDCRLKEGEKIRFITIYGYSDGLHKIYDIIGESKRMIFFFTEDICPLAFHLHKKRCFYDVKAAELP